MWRVFLLILNASVFVNALDNGLARTPPMGWLSWERFRCITNCTEYPNECINEQLFKDMAEVMSSEGYLEAGYEYIIIDDCWLEKERDSNGKLVADRERFPSGIKALADHVHSKGLKFGIYEDYGTLTCAGYPGSMGHEEIDAQTFAEWGVDYLKLDGCYSEPALQENGTALMGQYLNKTGRPILFSCEFPLYEGQVGMPTNYARAHEICNLWRNYGDIQDSWNSVNNIVKWFNQHQDEFQTHAGPGGWNDPDMLVIGNFALSYDQSKAQMAIWAILASPLLMSNDLRTIKAEFKEILLHEGVLGISQDSLGIQGRYIKTMDDIDIYTRPVTPVIEDKYSFAIAFVSRRDDGNPQIRKITLKELGFTNSIYAVQDIFEPESDPRILSLDSELIVKVNPSGVVLLKAIPR